MSEVKPSLFQSMALGGSAAMFAVNFTVSRFRVVCRPQQCHVLTLYHNDYIL